MIGHRAENNDDNNMVFKQMRISFNATGVPTAYEYLTTLIDSGKSRIWCCINRCYNCKC